MRAMSIAALALLVPIVIARSQATPAEINHRSPLAIARVLEARQTLQLTASQVRQLVQLQAELTRLQTRLVRIGTPGKAHRSRWIRIQVPLDPTQDVRQVVAVRPRFPGRVPGKLSTPRLERTARVALVDHACPFAMLGRDQMEQVHRLLMRG